MQKHTVITKAIPLKRAMSVMAKMEIGDTLACTNQMSSLRLLQALGPLLLERDFGLGMVEDILHVRREV